jgi:hypothetical protein
MPSRLIDEAFYFIVQDIFATMQNNDGVATLLSLGIT